MYHRRLLFPLALLLAPAALWAWDIHEDLLEAARNGDAAAIGALLEKGANLETTTTYGQTPLYVAAMNGHAGAVRVLLDRGAKTDVRDTFYKFPMLAMVVQRKHWPVVKMLITQKGSDPNTNLAAAVQSGQVQLVEAALASGKPGQETLNRQLEAANGKPEIAALLTKAGAVAAPAVEVDPKILASYAGTFKNDQFPLAITVSVKEGKLFLQATGQPEFAPKAKSPTLFEFSPANLQVEFTAADAFTLRQGGQTIVFKKQVAQ